MERFLKFSVRVSFKQADMSSLYAWILSRAPAPPVRVDKFSILRGMPLLRGGSFFFLVPFRPFSLHVLLSFSPVHLSQYRYLMSFITVHIFFAVVLSFFLQLLLFLSPFNCVKYDNRIITSVFPIRKREVIYKNASQLFQLEPLTKFEYIK